MNLSLFRRLPWLILLCLIGALSSTVVLAAEATSSATGQAEDDLTTLVADVDWTLTYEVDEASFRPEDPDYFKFDGKFFRYSDGVREFFRCLLANFPELRIAVYSGGSRERVEYALKNLKLGDGRTLYDVVSSVLAFEDLQTIEGVPATAPFPERKKKDLLRVRPGIRLDRVFHMDDILNFLAAGQERNILWLQRTFNFFEAPLPENFRPATVYDPPDRIAQALERNKLSWALEIIFRAFALVSSQGLSPRDAVATLQRSQDGTVLVDREDPKQYGIYAEGLRRMLEINPKMKYMPLPTPGFEDCDRLQAKVHQ